MDRHTGAAIEGIEHLRQSIRDILSTPRGSRAMNRDYGSRLFELLDAPVDHRFDVEVVAAAAEALREHEPRMRVERIRLSDVRSDGPEFELHGIYLPEGRRVVLENV